MQQLLIVDDEQHWVDSLAETIDWRSVGIGGVFKACSGFEALDMLQEHAIDIVITDIRMPEMDGLALIERIQVEWPNIKCIILTGHADFDYAKTALQHKVSNYLLKPAEDEELLAAVSRLVQELQQEIEQFTSNSNALRTLQQNLALIKSNLLQELISVKAYPLDKWAEKKTLLGLPFHVDEPYALLLLRIEDEHAPSPSDSLIQYAVCNIAEEVFSRYFHIWHSTDQYGYLVFLIQCNHADSDSSNHNYQLEHSAARLQHNVKVFLHRQVSILFSQWHPFPYGISQTYENVVSAFRQKVGDDREFFMQVPDQVAKNDMQAITSLYEPPTLAHLLDLGRWGDVEDKLTLIFKELSQPKYESQEHLLEAFFHFSSVFIFFAHKNNRNLSTLIGGEFYQLEGQTIRSIRQLEIWAHQIIRLLQNDFIKDMKLTRLETVVKVQQYLEHNLEGDVSLQTIADHVFLHPSHLSKIYKLETGEGLSQYLFRLRMEKAAFILNQHHLKIYEVGEKVGLPNTPYFIKLFKKHFGVTPQDYRDRQGP
ncbi:two component transcriptional regulator, AraC family [Paenibacillus curdlanolyticus YK9]|uniref:Two component transcriptional regulator, AraC family n=1 Tax=Paenibacillus curdlanolyticus YK9 TaxID=717606 RepID=E0I9N1_9BACL|nr:response regulator [Paenibacillus curdlanolyticus]EFM11115.1 two component transcriptional regulator, AraC family [Paenibacillus curdlanolyticus YK9]